MTGDSRHDGCTKGDARLDVDMRRHKPMFGRVCILPVVSSDSYKGTT